MKGNVVHPIVENINKIVEIKYPSKVAFACACGMGESKWNKISNGNQELSIRELSKIAEALKMPIQDIITYPDVYIKKEDNSSYERISVTFEVSPDKRDILLNLVTKS